MSQSGTTFECVMSLSLDVCPTIEFWYCNEKFKEYICTCIDTLSLYDNFIDEIKVTSNEDKMYQEMF